MPKLVTIGDSLTQGFHSFAITRTDQSFPALIGRAMGLSDAQFRLPNFRGAGGLPCSFEWIARRLQDRFGDDLSLFDWVRAIPTVTTAIDEVEEYWERGPGSKPSRDDVYHNLAVWGFEVGDAYNVTAELCRRAILGSKPDWFKPPSQSRLRTAWHVLNPAQLPGRGADTQLSLAARLRDEEGPIEHLVVWLGANNCLSTVIKLRIEETNLPPGPCSPYTLWSPSAFEKEYLPLADRMEGLKAEHVYVATVPHVTIPPVCRGIMSGGGELPPGEKYFDYYAHFFVPEEEFDPQRDHRLLKADAMKIDEYIDAYNAVIRREAKARGWHVVDICDVLDRLAYRRNHGRPTYPLPPELADLDARFFHIHANGALKHGGLIALDGVHPTYSGYAIVAQEFIDVMRQNEPSIANVDFAVVRNADELVSHPPRTLDDLVSALRIMERHFHISRWIDPSLP
jgi:GDSL-like Lipase/Acylhydrolase